MAYRGQPITEATAFEQITKRIRDLEDAQTSRMLPPGYIFNIVEGSLVITRQSDGANSTMVFA